MEGIWLIFDPLFYTSVNPDLNKFLRFISITTSSKGNLFIESRISTTSCRSRCVSQCNIYTFEVVLTPSIGYLIRTLFNGVNYLHVIDNCFIFKIQPLKQMLFRLRHGIKVVFSLSSRLVVVERKMFVAWNDSAYRLSIVYQLLLERLLCFIVPHEVLFTCSK